MRKLKVLLVDDNPAFLKTARDLLAAMPCVASVDCAASGADALGDLGELNPDLMLTDLVMPGMSGFELMRKTRVRALPPRIMAVTLHDGPEFRTAALRCGADGFIAKREFGVVARELLAHLADPDDA